MSILLEAEELINGDRQEDYGHPYDDFSKTAAMWSALAGVEIGPEMVPLFMIALKLSRQVHRPKMDNLVDIAGYAGTAEKVYDRQRELEISESDVERLFYGLGPDQADLDEMVLQGLEIGQAFGLGRNTVEEFDKAVEDLKPPVTDYDRVVKASAALQQADELLEGLDNEALCQVSTEILNVVHQAVRDYEERIGFNDNSDKVTEALKDQAPEPAFAAGGLGLDETRFAPGEKEIVESFIPPDPGPMPEGLEERKPRVPPPHKNYAVAKGMPVPPKQSKEPADYINPAVMGNDIPEVPGE